MASLSYTQPLWLRRETAAPEEGREWLLLAANTTRYLSLWPTLLTMDSFWNCIQSPELFYREFLVLYTSFYCQPRNYETMDLLSMGGDRSIDWVVMRSVLGAWVN
jgi:hypothetical protein